MTPAHLGACRSESESSAEPSASGGGRGVICTLLDEVPSRTVVHKMGGEPWAMGWPTASGKISNCGISPEVVRGESTRIGGDIGSSQLKSAVVCAATACWCACAWAFAPWAPPPPF
eukprot:6190411-Pleurochrysis_carterae.AAC.2